MSQQTQDLVWAFGAILFMIFVCSAWFIGFMVIIGNHRYGKKAPLIETMYECKTCGTQLLAIERHPESKSYCWCPKCEKWVKP